MRFSSALYTVPAAASIALVSAQEAARFGIVDVSPSGALTPNEVFPADYLYVDFYLDGQFDNGNSAPRLLISRNTYGVNQTLLVQNETLPNYGILGNVTYSLLAFVTYNQNGLTQIGGVLAP
ncbi:hypothetical protein GYMLUDRAFT_242739 [Collybiopsis luxurians FD-317 M1]|uniref:Uncharacterized protein n=1 Tax=Collybiopsis luxurians FD-317 M1 TaxID=944289 RepID=A0A0D0D0Q1_9AGAR|nr:hypothetical protein GYMLUDRAFT_242739 [Collybiopsis luxurians FD-317 M1]